MTNPYSPAIPSRIIHYSVSGDGKHVATLSVRNTDLHLDVWNLGEGGIAIDRKHQKMSMSNPVHFSTSMRDEEVNSDILTSWYCGDTHHRN